MAKVTRYHIIKVLQIVDISKSSLVQENRSWRQAESLDHLRLNVWQIVGRNSTTSADEQGTQLHLRY